MDYFNLTFLSFFRTRPGHKKDAVIQPYNNHERLLNFRLTKLKLAADEVRRTLHEGSTNNYQWSFKS